MDYTNKLCFGMSFPNLDSTEGWCMWLTEIAVLLFYICRHVM